MMTESTKGFMRELLATKLGRAVQVDFQSEAYTRPLFRLT